MKFRSGQSLVELLLAVALASVMLPALLTGLVASRQGRVQQEQRVKAVQLLQETQEAMRSIREKGWSNLTTNGTYHPIITGSTWSLASGSDVSGDYTRQIVITDVYRDTTTKQIVTSGGFLDPSTKRADITISWSIPYASSIASTVYLTRYLDNLVYLQTTKADFDSDTLVQLSTTNTSGGEVQISNNTKAKWCLPSFASSSIDLPDGPPVAVSATASASITTPNDVLVATAPYTTSSAKLAYIHVSANTDPPVSTLQGTFTLDASKYSDAGLVPTGIGLDNNFKTNDIKYYKSPSGKVYALLATNLPDKEIVVVQIKDANGDAFQDPTNKIYKYWTFFNTAIYGTGGDAYITPTSTPTPTNTPTPTSVPTDTGFLNPTANAAESGGDNNGFDSNATRAYSDNASFAVDTNSGTTTSTSCADAGKDKHRYYNYNVSIPAWATTITGIEVRLDARADSTTGSPQMCVQLSWDGGTTWTTAKSTSTLTTSEATYTLGGTGDTWGRTWDGSTNFTNVNFRLRVVNVASNTSRDFSLDWAAVKVYFSGLVPTNTPTPSPTNTPTPSPIPTTVPGANDQAPFDYGATTVTVHGNKGYVASGGYLYVFELSNIDSKSPSSGLDQIGCRIELDGFDCQPGNGTDKKYSAGQSGTTWSTTTGAVHLDCSDGGNIELYATNDIYPVQVGSNTYIFAAVGAGTNPEFNIASVNSIPTSGSSPSLINSSCGRITGGGSGWKRISSLDFNSQSNTEEAANSVYGKSDGSRAYISSNGGIDGNGDGQPDSKQFYVINTSNINSPAFLSGTSGTGATSGYYSGDATNIQMFPRRSLTVLNGQRAVLVGKDGYPIDATNPQEYQVIDITSESSPVYCQGLDYDAGFNDLTSVTEADSDNFVYMVVNANVNELKIIQGGPDGNYLDSGSLESPIYDVGYSTAFNKYAATMNKPANTSITFQFAGADPVSGSCTGANYVYTGPDGTSSTYYTATTAAILLNSSGNGYKNPAQCFRYKSFFSTTDYNTTPVLYDMSVNYSP